MKTGVVVLGGVGSLLSLLALLGWGAAVDAPNAGYGAPTIALDQVRPGGSEAPCAVPLAWRVTRVDREFGLDIPRATEIVRRAAALWQTAASSPLFVHDDSAGFPIRLVYDERQERTQQRMRRQAEVDRLSSAIEDERGRFVAGSAALDAAGSAHSERVRDFERRAAEHGATVRGWNERGGAPPDVATELGAIGEALAAERRELTELARTLETERRENEEAAARLNRSIQEHRRVSEQLARDFPPTPVESGEYREAVQRVGGRVVGISREIRIYRFAGEDELRLVAAHELGHALGLGHTSDGDAVMGEQHDVGLGAIDIDALAADDATLLETTCPSLVSTR